MRHLALAPDERRLRGLTDMTTTLAPLAERAPPTFSRAAALAPGVFASAVLLSACLVFLVEPMIAKMVLPTLGGAPAVWNTSLAFFQVALLIGYGYAHLLQRLRTVRVQIAIHGVVLLSAALILPLKVTHALGDPGATDPTLWLLGVLALSVGLPFAALSATAPLVQSWYARVRAGRIDAANPYVLYAASNLGSLIALLSYPILVEPTLRLSTQTLGWSLGYGLFVAVIAVVGVLVWPAGGAAATIRHVEARAAAPPVSWKDRLLWIALAAAPSSLMLGVTTHIATDIASAPFLWVAPLALYLLTFIIAFQARPLISPRTALLFQAAVFAACLLTFGVPIKWFLAQVALDLLGFFLTALVCHQALAARRPPAARLTEFYLLISVGGVIGGSFNAFLAPVIFKTVLEYPIVLALVCVARPWGEGRLRTREAALLAGGLAAGAAALAIGHFMGFNAAVRVLLTGTLICGFLLRDRAPAFAALGVVLLVSGPILTPRKEVLKVERSFFGVVRLERMDIPGHGAATTMVHGTTLHGAELTSLAERCRPLLYYAPTTPIGQVFRSVQARKPAVRIGAIGMGAGTVATYVRPGDSLRFFEIDPLVIRMADDPATFGYIHGCARGPIDHVLGDARLALGHEPTGQFDILLVDAFSSDTVPTHLLTVEAMRGYLSHIKPDGVVIMHLSNRNLELMQPVAAVAGMAGGAALQQVYRPPPGSVPMIDMAEDTMIVARNAAVLAPFRADPRWKPARSGGVRVWTDDYTNLFGALIRGIGHVERETRS
ncbi:MAG: fused MFS/spermidine synthase [Caulobacteraceae bacterium]